MSNLGPKADEQKEQGGASPKETRSFSAHDIDSLKIYCDFIYKSIVETVGLIKQGTVYYFVIVAATNSFLLTSASENIDRRIILKATILISACFLIIMASVAWGVLTGLAQLSASYRTLNADMYDKIRLGSYFTRGIVVGVVIVIMCMAILLIVVAGFYYQDFGGTIL